MRSYVPTVTCRGPLILASPQYSDEILRRMPASPGRIAFGRRGVPSVRVVLPVRYNSGAWTAQFVSSIADYVTSEPSVESAACGYSRCHEHEPRKGFMV